MAARTPQQRRYAGGLRPRTQDSRANRATTPAHGRSIRPVPVLDRHSMSRATATPDAPPALVAATHAVRRLIVAVDLNGSVHGWCVEASLILGWMLRQQGLPAEMRSCSAEGDPHWCITSGNGILDPTSGQWGEEPLLVFREGSSDDWYGPGREGPADISEDAIVHRFAGRISHEEATPLLAVAGLTPSRRRHRPGRRRAPRRRAPHDPGH